VTRKKPRTAPASPRRLPWRVQSGHDGGFDELVVGIGTVGALHVEMTDDRAGYLTIGNRQLWFYFPRTGQARVTYEENIDG
jgi:hypothetical protein